MMKKKKFDLSSIQMVIIQFLKKNLRLIKVNNINIHSKSNYKNKDAVLVYKKS